MKHAQGQSQSVWDCKDHVVWMPGYRRNVLYGRLRRQDKRTAAWITCRCSTSHLQMAQGLSL